MRDFFNQLFSLVESFCIYKTTFILLFFWYFGKYVLNKDSCLTKDHYDTYISRMEVHIKVKRGVLTSDGLPSWYVEVIGLFLQSLLRLGLKIRQIFLVFV
jgi:hypothetical protein